MNLTVINGVVYNAHGGMHNMVIRYAEVLRTLNNKVINVGIGSGHAKGTFDKYFSESVMRNLLKNQLKKWN